MNKKLLVVLVVVAIAAVGLGATVVINETIVEAYDPGGGHR